MQKLHSFVSNQRNLFNIILVIFIEKSEYTIKTKKYSR